MRAWHPTEMQPMKPKIATENNLPKISKGQNLIENLTRFYLDGLPFCCSGLCPGSIHAIPLIHQILAFWHHDGGKAAATVLDVNAMWEFNTHLRRTAKKGPRGCGEHDIWFDTKMKQTIQTIKLCPPVFISEVLSALPTHCAAVTAATATGTVFHISCVLILNKFARRKRSYKSSVIHIANFCLLDKLGCQNECLHKPNG